MKLIILDRDGVLNHDREDFVKSADEWLPIEGSMDAVASLKQAGYTPTRMHIGIGKRLGARFFADNVAVTDHPASERISGNYSVVTVESVFDFLHRSGALERELSIAHQIPVPVVAGAALPAQQKDSTP